MKLWSRGLGRTELTMDCRYYKVIEDPESGHAIVVGNMREPVNWEFTIKMEPHDIAGVMKLLFTWPMLKFVLRNILGYITYFFNRKKYVDPGHENLEQHVLATYEQIMSNNPSESRRARYRNRNKQKKPDDEMKAA